MSISYQIPTPDKYVNILLDLIGYKNNLFGKVVLENSCGEGNILIEIVKRYIHDARSDNKNNNEIVTGLQHDIVAFEIDQNCIKRCIERLNTVLSSEGLPAVVWNIRNEDFLKSANESFDFIIGNPPYITYHDLSEDTREYLRQNFLACSKGRFDYYYAFIEKSVMSLKETGRFAYLIPFNIFRNKFAENIRNIIKDDIIHIIDYSGQKVFSDATISSAIILCERNSCQHFLTYENVLGETKQFISKCSLGDKWFFDITKEHNIRFGDYFSVHNSVATLYNDAFLLTDYTQDDAYTYIDGYLIENNILYDAVSTKSIKNHLNDSKKDKIIFPYKIYENGYEKFSEDEMMSQFPNALRYLQKFETQLSLRDINYKAKWYEYGRTQALREVYGKKLIIPMIITRFVVAYEASENSIPYAGYFVKAKHPEVYDLKFAKKVLESTDFYEYVKEHGTPTTSTSYRISVRDIENYCFNN